MEDYTPRTLMFDRAGVEWVLENYHTLSSGNRPWSDPSGYTEMPAHRQGGIKRASFETPVLIAVEVMLRVKRCGLDGYLVEEKYCHLKTEQEIARERHLRYDDVCRRINKVLWYCASGWTPRWLTTRKHRGQTYDEWKKDTHGNRRFRAKGEETRG